MAAIIRFVARIIIGLLWIRFVLKFFAVNASGIITTLYQWTGYLIDPFRGVFESVSLGGRFTIESTTLFAIVVYALIEFILVRLFHAARSDE